jgi:cation transport ATPase
MKQAGLVPVLVTGDNSRTAKRVAEEVGIDQYFGAVLPG